MNRHAPRTLRRPFPLLPAIVLNLALLSADGGAAIAGPEARPPSASPRTALPVTVASRDQKAYGHALPMTEAGDFPRVLEGKRVFARTWLPAGEGPLERQGLGPLYNAASCADCHFKDGRGGRMQTPPPLIFRLLATDTGDRQSAAGTQRVPAIPQDWGSQLQNRAVHGAPEGRVEVTIEAVEGRYADGTRYTLYRPRYVIAGHGPESASRLGPRVPPTLVGVGLLEAVDEATILAWADPDDANGDGISGRVSQVDQDERHVIGRFGWKAAQPGLNEQVAGALAEDMGIVPPGRASPDLAAEISREDFQAMLVYLRLFAPPAQRTDHPLFERGKRIFDAAGCGGCHRENLTTGGGSSTESVTASTALADREIMPYSDLLLHDLGEYLADGSGSRDIDREWRTAPLWGLGLMRVVNGHLRLLHDGRALTFEEAILWHGGEAETSRERFRRLKKADRDALVAFLESI